MKRAVLMIIDGLRSDMVGPTLTPNLHRLASRGRRFLDHRSVFPSATRVNSASIATGCLPGSHGLHGNVIALDEGAGLVPVSVGPATFRERLRRATGRTLLRPTLSERLRERGGVATYTNSSPGSAHMQDPDGHGWLFHRSGSHGPGFCAVAENERLEVGYDADGDRETTRRLCAALDRPGDIALHTLWVCEPDHSQHALELGSPEHAAVLAEADRNVGRVIDAVDALRARGDDVLFVAASDHGHETTGEIVPIVDRFIEAGFKADADSGDVVVASSGMGVLVYLGEAGANRRSAIAEWLRDQPWCGPVFAGDSLVEVGHDPHGGVGIAFGMAKSDEANRFGVPGIGAVADDGLSDSNAPGCGQHGGLGAYETNATLIVDGGDLAPGDDARRTRAVDIAPTILDFLTTPADGVDGRSLLAD